MNNTVRDVLIFAAGAVVGATVATKLIQKRYEEYEDYEEYDEEYIEEDIIDEPQESPYRKPNLETAAKQLREQGFIDYTSMYRPGEPEDIIDEEEVDALVIEPDETDIPVLTAEKPDRPYVISPEEFGDLPDYDVITLTYYEGDCILADELDDVIDDVDTIVGFDAFNHFGDYEDDSVHIRNDALKCDYEILLDIRSYLDVIAPKQTKSSKKKKSTKTED